MRAAIPDGAGGVCVVDTPVPDPAPGEVLVRVEAAGMNRADLLHARGAYAQRAFVAPGRPDIAGMEMAGRIVALGAGVDPDLGLEAGSAVMAMCGSCYAEYVAVDAQLVMRAPPQLSWTECAALPMGLLTEYEALVRLAETRAGDRVLLTGATTAVGLIGVQIARLTEPAALVVTSRSPSAATTLRRLGADVVATGADDLTDAAGPNGFDVVIDHIGGTLFERALSQLRTNGRIVSVGRIAERSASVDLTALASRRARLIGTTWKTQTLDDIAETVAAVRSDVLSAVDAGRVVPIVAGTVGLSKIAAGYRLLRADRPPGKQVVDATA